MNYAAINLCNKLIWMTRQLREKTLASEIQEWVAAMGILNDLLVADLVHVEPLFHGVDLLHSYEGLAQGNRSESAVKEEESNVGIDSGKKIK